MIQVSERAQEEVRRLLVAAGKPGGGLRIAAPDVGADADTAAVDVAVVDAPGAADRILDLGRVRLFLDPQALAVANGGELVVSDGELELVLPAAPAASAARPVVGASAPDAQWDGRVLLGNRDQELPSVEDDEAARRYVRPLWLVAALTVLTFGVYVPMWLGMTWAEMKRELRDDTMRPFWHALASLVPLYGLFRFHAHFETIGELPWPRGVYGGVRADHAVLGIFVSNALTNGRLASFLSLPPLAAWAATLVGLALAAAVVENGQRALNQYWAAAYPGRAATRVHWSEWLLLALGGCCAALAVVGTLSRG